MVSPTLKATVDQLSDTERRDLLHYLEQTVDDDFALTDEQVAELERRAAELVSGAADCRWSDAAGAGAHSVTYVLHLSPAIEGDVTEAAEHYAEIDPALALRFAGELERTLCRGRVGSGTEGSRDWAVCRTMSSTT